MIIPSLRSAVLVCAAVLGLTVGPSLHAQVRYYYWTGAADSNYLNAANWAVGTTVVGQPVSYTTTPVATVPPGALSDIVLTSAPTGRVINLNYTGTGDYTQQIYSIQTGVSLGYTMNLSGTASGRLIYSVVGRGTHPFTTDPTGNGTGNSALRMGFYLNAGPYTTINFVGNANNPNPGGASATSGLAYAKITLNNARISSQGMTGNVTLPIGGLNMDANSVVDLDTFGMTVSGLLATGETELWAGTINQTATGTDAATGVATGNATQKWGTGITRVTPTGVINHPGGFYLRARSQYLVDGVHNGPIFSNNSTNSIVGGRGTINGVVTIGTATSLAPAGPASFGTLTINAPAGLNAGLPTVILNGALSFELNSPTEYDRLIINGILQSNATGSLAVGVTETFPLQPGTFRVMTFNSMIGSFGSVALPSSQGLAASYVLGSNYLDIVFTQLAYGNNPLLMGNHTIVAKVIDQAVLEGKAPGKLLDNLNRQPSINFFRDVLDQLMPTCYYGWYPAAVTRNNAVNQTIDDRLSQQGERVKGVWEPFVQTSRQESSIEASEWADYTNYDTISVLGGVDTMVGPSSTVGAFLEYTSTHTDLNQLFSSSTTDSFTGGLYANYKTGAFTYQAVGVLGVDKYESRRNVERTKLSEWAKGSTDGKHMGATLSAAYTLKYSWIEVSPNLGAQVLNWAVDGFTETEGKEANLRVKSQNETDFSGRAGIRFAKTFSTKRGSIRPFANISYLRSFGDDLRTIKGETFGTSIAVTVPGVQKTGIRFDAGVDWSVASRVSAQLRYSTETGGAADESVAIRGGVNVTF